MRLIDADKLQTDTVYTNSLIPSAGYVCTYSEMAIENAPTVEAIPISWLEKWFNYHKTEAIWLAMAGSELLCQMIIDDWEAENGRKTNDSQDDNAL